MSEPGSALPLYHVLLIGIDAYPPGYNGLTGCVNDIDAVERLLLDPPGVGVPPGQIRVTRLAAAQPGAPSQSRFANLSLPPTRANVLAALKSLAGPETAAADRVLIYYSGHGNQLQIGGQGVWHEAIVPHDGVEIQYVFDFELNPLIDAIAARTSDLTVILDSCHSGGATRDLLKDKPQGAARFLRVPPGQEPGVAPGGPSLGPGALPQSPRRMLQALDPSYIAVAACQSEESAREGDYEAGQPHGNLTHALLKLLGPMNADQRAQARWADIWPALLEAVSLSGAALHQPAQHPAWIGRAERHVFGGAWQPMDAGYPVSAGGAGAYTIGAGSLLGVTAGADLAVYGPPGPPPDFFLFSELGAIGSAAELAARRGLLRVTGAGRASSVAAPVDASFASAPGMRARLIKPGMSERLRVAIEPPDAALAAELERSAFLAAAELAAADAEVRLHAQAGGGWELLNDLQEHVATAPANALFALRAGLESYARYNLVLRLAKNCQDPQLANCLSIRLLDCNDAAALAAADPSDPRLPEAPRDEAKVYALAEGALFCVQLSSTYNDPGQPLHVSVFDCGAAGEVEYLGDTTLRAGDHQVLWLRAQERNPFIAGADFPNGATDRLIAVATSRPDIDLKWLAVDQQVQAVMIQAFSAKNVLGGNRGPAAPGELWTAAVVPLRIGFGRPA